MTGMRRGILAAAVLGLGLAQTASAQVKLELKWPEKSSYTLETVVKLDQTLEIMGMEIPTQSEETIQTTRSIGEKRSDGSIPVEITTDSLKANLNLPGGNTIAFDSANPDAPVEEDSPFGFLVDTFKALTGAKYTIVVGKDGKVTAVEGTEKVLDKANQISPQAADILKSQLNGEKMKESLNDEFGVFPDILLRPGETWARTHKQDIGGGQTFTYDTTYTYEGTVEKDGKTLDRISKKATSVKYSQDPESAAQAKVEKSDLKIESSEGSILFDREAGLIVDSKEKTRIVGTMLMTVMGQQLDTELDLTWDESTTAKPK